jgi:hypothetical protein
VSIATASNNYILGVHKQTNESTVGTVASYGVPVYSADVGPRKEARRIEVTDAASWEGDIYYGPSSWSAQAEFPAFADSLGRFLQLLWPTDTTTGAGPYTHTFSGLGGTQSWCALYARWGAGSKKHTFGKGQATGISFAVDQDGGPLRVGFSATGQTVTDESSTVTTTNALTDGHLTLQASGASFYFDPDTPNSAPGSSAESFTSFNLQIDRAITPQPTVDSPTVSILGQGKGSTTLSMSMLYSSWDVFNASYFGAVAGTSLSSTKVQGAAKLTFKHTVQAGWNLSLYLPAVTFMVEPPQPNPSGDALQFTVNGYVEKPSSGDHVQPVLINAVSGSY